MYKLFLNNLQTAILSKVPDRHINAHNNPTLSYQPCGPTWQIVLQVAIELHDYLWLCSPGPTHAHKNWTFAATVAETQFTGVAIKQLWALLIKKKKEGKKEEKKSVSGENNIWAVV